MKIFDKIIFFSFSETGNFISSEFIRKIRETKEDKKLPVSFNHVTGYYMNSSKNAQDLIPINELCETIAKHFSNDNILVFISEVSKTTRLIAPFIENPLKDCSVLVIDEEQNYIIELLKSHAYNSNTFKRLLEKLSDATIVNTNPIDENTFHLEKWLEEFNYEVLNKEVLPYFKNKEICLQSDFLITDNPMKNLVLENFGKFGVYILNPIEKKNLVGNFSIENTNLLLEDTFFKHTLLVYPKDFLNYKDIIIGINCEANTKPFDIEKAFKDIILKASIDVNKIASITSSYTTHNSLDLLSEKYNLPINYYNKETLMDIDDEEFMRTKLINLLKYPNNLCMRSSKMFAINKFIDEISNINNYNFDVDINTSINHYLGNFLNEKIIYEDISISIYKMNYRIYFNK